MAQTRTRRTNHKGYPQRGEVYLTALDPALGHEIKKTRPTLIIQNDISNQYSSTTNRWDVYDRFAQAITVPANVTRDGLAVGDTRMIDAPLGQS